ncbi:hypothetical protein GCM10025734_81370 [Kitasatospora paranensis]
MIREDAPAVGDAPARVDMPAPVDAPPKAAGRRAISWARQLRDFGYGGPPHPSVHDRLVVPFPAPGTRVWRALGLPPAAAYRLARWSGWGGPLLVALLAGLPRFWRLGSPRAVVFDETYYAKDAWSLLQHGYETGWPDRLVSDPQILARPQGIPLSDTGAFVAHPPTGKWVIALGEWMFGLHPFGWRFMTAALGTLSVLMLCRTGRRLFRSTLLGCVAGALLAMDGLHLVMSRTALLDLVVMVFALAAFGCLLIDRDRARARLAAALPVDEEGRARPDGRTGDRAGTGARPWRLAAGLFLGLSASTKWNGLYFLAFFIVLTLLWDVGARRVAGAHRPYLAVLRRDGRSVLALVPVAGLTYLATWTGWFLSDGGYGRHWADGRDSAWPWIPAALRSLWHYEAEVYRFNVGLHTPTRTSRTPGAGSSSAGPCCSITRSRRWGRTAAVRRPGAPRPSSPWARRSCGGRHAAPWCTCSTGGRCAATGAPVPSCARWVPGTCPGSCTRTGRSSPSTPSCSRPTCAWP